MKGHANTATGGRKQLIKPMSKNCLVTVIQHGRQRWDGVGSKSIHTGPRFPCDSQSGMSLTNLVSRSTFRDTHTHHGNLGKFHKNQFDIWGNFEK